MILHALYEYYLRLLNTPGASVAEPGFSSEKISAVIVLDGLGNLVQLKDIRSGKDNKKNPVAMIVPQSSKRTGRRAFEHPFFLWDNTGFVLGRDDKGDDDKAELKFKNFKKRHNQFLANCNDNAAKALLLFLDKWDSRKCLDLPNWDDLCGKNLVFQLNGERDFIHQQDDLKKVWIENCGDGNVKYAQGMCSVSGQKARIPNIHSAIKGVKNAQTTGAAIVSFNQNAFRSYGKEQNYNCPISESVVFAYTTALNYLLRHESTNKVQIGDTTTAFWTERESPLESFFGLAMEPHDVESSDNNDLMDFLMAVRDGKALPRIDKDIQFYILGLSPNAARLSVRFWYVSNVDDISRKIGQHYQDLQIARNEKEPKYPSMWRLLYETANKKSKDGPPPLLAGAIMRSILEGTAYPPQLLSLVINRIRADQTVNYFRASLIKASLVRKSRIFKRNDLEVSMSLNTENKNTAYLLGRLFAVLEKVQQEAIPGVNSTVKDRYYGSASATPRAVFPQLLRLAQHHIAKSQYGVVSEKRIEDIVGNILEFPAHLSIDKQGLFAIGYYHQRKDFFIKKADKKESATTKSL